MKQELKNSKKCSSNNSFKYLGVSDAELPEVSFPHHHHLRWVTWETWEMMLQKHQEYFPVPTAQTESDSKNDYFFLMGKRGERI